MAFILNGQTVLSFADFQDVLDRDQRLFEANEGLTDDVVETQLIRATERILTELRATTWWKDYYLKQSNITINTVADIPALDPTKILARQADFTDLCVFKALGEYILPSIADFGTEDNAERQKMGYYVQKTSQLFQELVTAGDWYDFGGDGVIASDEKVPGISNLRRVR